MRSSASLLLFTLAKTTGGRWFLLLALAALCTAGCPASPPAPKPSAPAEAAEALSRTEFTGKMENFFEYEPLRADTTSTFLIHLTDLRDGAPVEKATVTLSARPRDGGEATKVTARVGRVTGIYVADLRLPRAGNYEIEFHVRNDRLDETMKLTDFKVEPR